MRGKANHGIRLLCALVLVLMVTNLSTAESRESLWRQVDNAIERGLPQTAIAILDQIIPEALADQAYAEATKAICLKIALQGQIQGGKI